MTLEQWFKLACKRGQIYYTARVSRTNMSALYSLYVVDDDARLERAWPNSAHPAGGATYDEKLAKRLGFRLSKRAWHRGGCGYDRVHEILYSMAREFGEPLTSINHIARDGLDVE